MRSILIALISFFVCFQSIAQTPTAYEKELDAWNKKRVAYLKSESGWLNLAGLFWLQPGENKIGTSEENTVVLPAGKGPALAGNLQWQDGQVKLFAEPNTAFSIANKSIQQAIVYHPDSTAQPVVALGSLRFHIIKRDTKIGVRLRDLEHPALAAFKGVDRFTPDTAYKVTAQLVPATGNKTIAITNVLGQTMQQPSPGTLVFAIKGKTYSLEALTEGEELFILFGDKTNGYETYGAGRFLYAAMPAADGKVLLDFNKAINPPCAFTPYATCPLPPRQNQLPLRIPAGEQFEGEH